MGSTVRKDCRRKQDGKAVQFKSCIIIEGRNELNLNIGYSLSKFSFGLLVTLKEGKEAKVWGKENYSILIWLEVSLDIQVEYLSARWLYTSGTRSRNRVQMKRVGSLALRFVERFTPL